MSGPNFAYFMECLDALENLLHAETQAIAAQHLDTIDSIMKQKDSCLKAVMESKDLLKCNPRDHEIANTQIDFVINLQARNANSFKKLKERIEVQKNNPLPAFQNVDSKLRSTYLSR